MLYLTFALQDQITREHKQEAAALSSLGGPDPTGRKGRLSVLRTLAKALWDCVEITHIATYTSHCLPCLALCFVPGIPGTLAWVEESARVHVCNVLHPSAHQVIHLRTLPMQMALGKDGAYNRPEELSQDENWGFSTEEGEDTIEFQVRFCFSCSFDSTEHRWML